MEVAWNPLGIVGVAAGALALALARGIARAGNRRLALLLVLEGTAAILGTGLLYFAADERSALALQRAALAAALALPSAYLLVLAQLPTRLVAPLAGRRGLALAAALALALEATLLARPGWFVEGVAPTWYARQESTPGPLAWVPVALLLGVTLYGFVAAMGAYREAPPATMRRVRARAYALAFGTRDVVLALVLVVPLVGALLAPSRAWDLFPVLGFPFALLVYVPLLAYGILRTQLFDVELRVKTGVQRALVLGAFLGAYALVSQVVALLAGPRWATLVGVAAAGALAFAILPLERSAARVADAVMPRVRDEERYLAARRLEVYRASLEEGTVPPDRLRALRDRLGITDAEHALLVELADRARVGGAQALVLGRYAPLRALGSGGSGEAFLARDELLGREVVVKRVRGGGREALAEARALALARDPHVVTVHDAARDGSETVVVMEHVPGGSLAERIARGPLDEDGFLRVARGLLRALDALHAMGVVHRDVKPANVLLTERGEAKLADLGLAGALDVRGATAAYAAPEVLAGGRASPASDLWSAAATLREAAPRSVQDVLAPWCARAMAPRPEERFGSAREALEALEPAFRRARTREGIAPPR